MINHKVFEVTTVVKMLVRAESAEVAENTVVDVLWDMHLPKGMSMVREVSSASPHAHTVEVAEKKPVNIAGCDCEHRVWGDDDHTEFCRLRQYRKQRFHQYEANR